MWVWRFKCSELVPDRYLTRLSISLAVAMSALFVVAVVVEEGEGVFV